MRKSSLIAATLTLALTGAPAVTVAAATSVPDPIAHAAGDPIAHAAGQHASPYVDPLGHHHHRTPYVDPLGPGSHLPAFRHACADESRDHVAGHPGTPFSECVRALRSVSTGARHTAVAACRAEPRRHHKGVTGTAFTRCVAAARALIRTEHIKRRSAPGPR